MRIFLKGVFYLDVNKWIYFWVVYFVFEIYDEGRVVFLVEGVEVVGFVEVEE